MAFQACLLSLSLYASFAKGQSDPTVSIPSGTVIGTATRLQNQPKVTANVNAYLGVPFASSPPERFSPPAPAREWSSPLQAQELKPGCLSQFNGSPDMMARSREYFNNPFGPEPVESEDCLYLNVYAPPDASPTSLKPVMFWIYGGNLASGSNSFLIYNGSSLAIAGDVVVVSANYRTNIFGFPGSSELPFGETNTGFLDQRAALVWVQDNIRAFGGDPEQVTLFGESAGGYSVKQLIGAPPNPLTFRAGIMESQGAAIPASPEASFNNAAAHFGCNTPGSRVECMRGPSATDIQAHIQQAGISFGPVRDNITAVSSFSAALRDGTAADVPVMIGSNANETTILLAAQGVYEGTSALDLVYTLLGIVDPALRDALVDAIGVGPNDDPLYLANRILTDTTYTCAASIIGEQTSESGRTTFRYRFNGAFPNTQFLPFLGAYHSSEIPEVFGSYPVTTEFGEVTARQKSLSAYMQGAWASFARDPEVGPGWPALGTANGVELGDLGLGASNETTNPLLAADYLCLLLAPFVYASGNVD